MPWRLADFSTEVTFIRREADFETPRVEAKVKALQAIVTSKRMTRDSIGQLHAVIWAQVERISLNTGNESVKEVGKRRAVGEDHVAILSLRKIQLAQICSTTTDTTNTP